MRTIVDSNKCCGCLACHDACTLGAIKVSMQKGFPFPFINEQKCVQCKKCENVCPMINKAENEEYDEYDPVVWAAWNASDEKLLDSTSGGIFVELAERFIRDGGWVCGCAFSDDYKSCYHTLINKMEDIRKLTHSKYFQSNTSGIYNSISELLKKGEKVLFCGTPCQTAALHKFIKSQWREGLTLADLFCKGVPSPVIHAKFLSMLEEKEHSKIIYFRSKSKAKGWGKFFTEVRFSNGKVRFIRSPLDNLFVTQELDVRESCAHCEYKGLDRVSDISIGDYWGVTGIDNSIVKKGMSAILVSTDKGARLVESLGDSIKKEKRSVFDVSNKKNPGFSKKIELNPRYDHFFEDVEKLPLEKVIKKYASSNSMPILACRKLKWALQKVRGISIPTFIYINFLSRHVKRGKGAYIIPGPHTIFDFQTGSVLTLERGKALINFRKPKGSREEAWIQLNENAHMVIHEGLDMRNCRVVVQPDALLEIGEMEMNGLCNIIVRKKVLIGKGVMVARNVTIYDSDYHPFSLIDDVQSIVTKPTTIKDHVWIGNGSAIMKGVTVGEGAVISARAVVIKSVKTRTMVSGNPAAEVCQDVFWAK